MFQDYFLLHFLFNVLRLLFLLFGSILQDFSSLSHIKNSLHLYPPFSLLLLYIHMPTTLHVISSQIHSYKNKVIYLYSFKDTYIISILWYHLIQTCVSRLWPRKGDCIFFIQMKEAYRLMLKSDVVDFVKVVICFWVFGCLRFWFEKVINVFCFRNKEKKK